MIAKHLLKITLILIILSSCSSQSRVTKLQLPETDNIESKFYGSWSGMEENKQIDGASKHWIQHRFKSGKYILIYMVIYKGEIFKFSEEGKWWIKDGFFFELNSTSEKPDKYEFKVIDDYNIWFKEIDMQKSDLNGKYEFVDKKL